ncbi:DUF397 domain-containing protein [Sphaerisporangium sp. NPDC004334]
MELAHLSWRKSSYSSGNGGDCVEVASLPAGMAVRDSKNPAGPTLRFSCGEWRTFVHSLRTSELASR